MSSLNEKIFKPRKVLLKENVGLVEIYEKVKVVLCDNKIFVSLKLFAEQWDICRKNSGDIKVTLLGKDKICYGLNYTLPSGVNENIVFLVCGEKVGARKIQLMHIKSPKARYNYEKTFCQDAVFLDRAKEREFELL